jgi:hypothetical protein
MRHARWFTVCALGLLSACYAVPERHSVSSEVTEGDAGSRGDADEPDLDADVDRVDGGRRDGGAQDAATGCDCDLDRPLCIEATKTCVECTAEGGGCRPNQVCDVLHGDCVECLQNADCKDPNASVCDLATHTCKRCEPSSESDCGHIKDKHVCMAGTCVQCTKDKLDACKVQSSPTKTVQNACHALTHTCTENELRKTPPCGECVSDAQCWSGHACVGANLGNEPLANQWYCLPMRELNCASARPYSAPAPARKTIDGVTQDICSLRVASCGALNNYINTFCGVDLDGMPIPLDAAGVPQAPSANGDSRLCGVPGVDDGYCVEVEPGLHRCTVACSEILDCPRIAPACNADVRSPSGFLCAIP